MVDCAKLGIQIELTNFHKNLQYICIFLHKFSFWSWTQKFVENLVIFRPKKDCIVTCKPCVSSLSPSIVTKLQGGSKVLTEEVVVKVAILHELVHQDLQSIVVTKAFQGTKVAVMKAAEERQFVAELQLPLRTFIGGAFDGHGLARVQNAFVHFPEPPFSDVKLVAEIISGSLQLG